MELENGLLKEHMLRWALSTRRWEEGKRNVST